MKKTEFMEALFGSDNVDIRNSIVRIKGVWVEFDANGNIIVDDKGLKKFKSMMQKISIENKGKKGGLFNSLKSKFSRSSKAEDENYKEIHDPIQTGCRDGMPTDDSRQINKVKGKGCYVKDAVFYGPVRIGCSVNGNPTGDGSSSNETPSGSDFQGSQMGEE